MGVALEDIQMSQNDWVVSNPTDLIQQIQLTILFFDMRYYFCKWCWKVLSNERMITLHYIALVPQMKSRQDAGINSQSESESESVYCQVGLHLPGIFLDMKVHTNNIQHKT